MIYSTKTLLQRLVSMFAAGESAVLQPTASASFAAVKIGPSVFPLFAFGGRRFESDDSDGVPAAGERRERCAAGLMTMNRRAVTFSTLTSQGKSPNQALLPTSTIVMTAASAPVTPTAAAADL